MALRSESSPAHMQKCEPQASFFTYGTTKVSDATKPLSATLTLYASGNLLSLKAKIF